MNNIRNRVQLIGRLGADPEVKQFDSNKKMARMRVATNEVYQNAKGEKIENTHWHNVVTWGKLADLAETYLHKGEEVMVEGKLSYRQYTDKEGNNRYITEVEAYDFVLMGSRKAVDA